jgi:hypothetical protein
MAGPRLAALCLFALAALGCDGAAAASCRVLDPELQGAYEGGCKDGLAEGEGTARGMAEYRGGFHAGKKDGQGIKTWPWGDRYQGGFADDRKEGEGSYSWAVNGGAAAGEASGGESYSGHFHADRRDGMGTYAWPGGGQYRGRWADDWPLDPIDGALFERLRAQARAGAEARAALGVPGVKVCRALPMGISEHEWVAGEVVGMLGDAIAVKITQDVKFPLTLNGIELAPGAVVWDTPAHWRRCI